MFPFSNPLGGNGNPFGNFGNTGGQGQPSQNNGFQNPFSNGAPNGNGMGFGQGFPFNTEQLQQQINETISSSMPDFLRGSFNGTSGTNSANTTKSTQKVDVFETHDFIVARIPVTESDAKPKLSLDTTRLYVKGLPGDTPEQVVSLPAPIKPKYTKAEYKQGVLEVRMLKKGPEPMTDINIDG